MPTLVRCILKKNGKKSGINVRLRDICAMNPEFFLTVLRTLYGRGEQCDFSVYRAKIHISI